MNWNSFQSTYPKLHLIVNPDWYCNLWEILRLMDIKNFQMRSTWKEHVQGNFRTWIQISSAEPPKCLIALQGTGWARSFLRKMCLELSHISKSMLQLEPEHQGNSKKSTSKYNQQSYFSKENLGHASSQEYNLYRRRHLVFTQGQRDGCSLFQRKKPTTNSRIGVYCSIFH